MCRRTEPWTRKESNQSTKSLDFLIMNAVQGNKHGDTLVDNRWVFNVDHSGKFNYNYSRFGMEATRYPTWLDVLWLDLLRFQT